MKARKPARAGERRCSACGCTEATPCVHPSFGPCRWSRADRCNYCDGDWLVTAIRAALVSETQSGGDEPLVAVFSEGDMDRVLRKARAFEAAAGGEL